MKKRALLTGLFCIGSAQAYIDPGTAGTIIGGSIWPFIAGIFAVIGGFLVKYFFSPIKRGFLALWKKIKK